MKNEIKPLLFSKIDLTQIYDFHSLCLIMRTIKSWLWSIEDCTGPYANEPIASAEWIANYKRENKEEEDRRKELQARLTAGLDAVKAW